MENTTREQIASTRALVVDAGIHLFGDVSRATESRPDTELIFVKQTVVSRALTKCFRNDVVYSAVQEEAQKCVLDPSNDYAIAAKLVDVPSFIIL